MIRLVAHLAIGFSALAFLVYAVYFGTDWAEVAATFFFGWFCGKAHGCCTVCKTTAKWDEDQEYW